VRYTVSQSVKTCATENTGFFACFAKRTFRHLSSNMAKHHRTTSIKATPPCVRCTTTPIIHTSLVIPSLPFNSPQRFKSRTATNARLVSAARRSFASKTAINETLRESTS
jgi:hypothetical protein